MTPVKVKQLRGELGLRAPGTIVSTNDETASYWIERGWAEPVAVAQMPEVETPEPKRKRKPPPDHTKEETFKTGFQSK